MVRYERFGLGETWNDEYGTAADPERARLAARLLALPPRRGTASATRRCCSPSSTATPGSTRCTPARCAPRCSTRRPRRPAPEAAQQGRPARRSCCGARSDVGHGARAVSRSVSLAADTPRLRGLASTGHPGLGRCSARPWRARPRASRGRSARNDGEPGRRRGPWSRWIRGAGRPRRGAEPTPGREQDTVARTISAVSVLRHGGPRLVFASPAVPDRQRHAHRGSAQPGPGDRLPPRLGLTHSIKAAGLTERLLRRPGPDRAQDRLRDPDRAALLRAARTGPSPDHGRGRQGGPSRRRGRSTPGCCSDGAAAAARATALGSILSNAASLTIFGIADDHDPRRHGAEPGAGAGQRGSAWAWPSGSARRTWCRTSWLASSCCSRTSTGWVTSSTSAPRRERSRR